MMRDTLWIFVLGTALAAAGCLSDLPGRGGPDGDGTGGTYPGFPGAGTGSGAAPMIGAIMTCYFDEEGEHEGPIAAVEHTIETFGGVDAVRVRVTFDPTYVDNTYGDGSIGWGNRGHRFSDLWRSDHLQLLLSDGNGATVVDFKMDYLHPDDAAASGYATLGVGGGDGQMIAGDRAAVLAVATSLDRNLNERGYSSYLEHSPATDESFSPNPAAPEWDFRMVYEAWVSVDAFGAAGFGDAFITHIHASPAKSGRDDVPVTPDPCPPDWGCPDPDGCEDDYCTDPDGCDRNPPPDLPEDPEDPYDPNDPNDPNECEYDEECAAQELCEEGRCVPFIG